jgi:hypothetical protein
MLDYIFDTEIDEDLPESRTQTITKSRQAAPTESSLEEDALTVAELAYTLYSLHGAPQPLELMRLLNTIDSQFLSDGKQKNPEEHLVEEIFGIFF